MTAPALPALLFDGRTAAARPVLLGLEAGRLRVATPEGAPLRDVALAQLAVSEPFEHAPRQVALGDGAVLEVADGAALSALLAGAGRREGLVDQLQQRWPAALAALAVTAGLLVAGYLWVLPALARQVARAMPASLERRLGDGVLELLDGQLLEPTELAPEEIEQVTARLAEAATLGAPGQPYRLVFRGSRLGGAMNAFALPGGAVVVLDGLVRRTGGDDRLTAVIGHELAHLSRHHSAEALVHGAGLTGLAGLLWGDFSSAAANLPAALAVLGHSRDAEREADEEAVRFLRAAGRPPGALVELLCLFSEEGRSDGLIHLPDLFSSHPSLDERLAHARTAAGVEGACRDERDGPGAQEPPRPQGDGEGDEDGEQLEASPDGDGEDGNVPGGEGDEDEDEEIDAPPRDTTI